MARDSQKALSTTAPTPLFDEKRKRPHPHRKQHHLHKSLEKNRTRLQHNVSHLCRHRLRRRMGNHVQQATSHTPWTGKHSRRKMAHQQQDKSPDIARNRPPRPHEMAPRMGNLRESRTRSPVSTLQRRLCPKMRTRNPRKRNMAYGTRQTMAPMVQRKQKLAGQRISHKNRRSSVSRRLLRLMVQHQRKETNRILPRPRTHKRSTSPKSRTISAPNPARSPKTQPPVPETCRKQHKTTKTANRHRK